MTGSTDSEANTKHYSPQRHRGHRDYYCFSYSVQAYTMCLLRRSGFSREDRFAAKAAPTYNNKILCVLCASVANFFLL